MEGGNEVTVYEDICPACNHPKRHAEEPCEKCHHDPQGSRAKMVEEDTSEFEIAPVKREVGQCIACKEAIPLTEENLMPTMNGPVWECPACYCLHSRNQFALIWEEGNAPASSEGESERPDNSTCGGDTR